MQLGIIGVILAIILAGGALLYSGASDESSEKEVMQKEVMEKEVMMAKEAMEKEAMMKEETMAKEEMMKKEDSMHSDDAMMKKDGATMEKKDEAMKKDGAMMEKDAMMVKGSIQNYSPEKLALAEKGKVLLFFHAQWCPICRGLDAEAAANPNITPDGITVLKVDFDTATTLRQKYGVTVQHTFVQVDSSGNLLKKFSDASTYSAVFGKVQ